MKWENCACFAMFKLNITAQQHTAAGFNFGDIVFSAAGCMHGPLLLNCVGITSQSDNCDNNWVPMSAHGNGSRKV